MCGRSKEIGQLARRLLVVAAVVVALGGAFASFGTALATNAPSSAGQRHEPARQTGSAVDFEHELDGYAPKKDRYNFYGSVPKPVGEHYAATDSRPGE